MAASAEEAQQMLKALRPMGQQAAKSNWSHALKLSERAFLNMAKLAERQAAKGNTAGMERALAAMNRYAEQQERLTGHTGRAAKHAQEVERNLRLVAAAAEEEERDARSRRGLGNRVEVVGAAANERKNALLRRRSARRARWRRRPRMPRVIRRSHGPASRREKLRSSPHSWQRRISRLRLKSGRFFE